MNYFLKYCVRQTDRETMCVCWHACATVCLWEGHNINSVSLPTCHSVTLFETGMFVK